MVDFDPEPGIEALLDTLIANPKARVEEAMEAALDAMLEQKGASSLSRAGRPPGSRRAQWEMDALRRALKKIIAVDKPMTVRQVFYRAVVKGLVDKTEGEYEKTICKQLVKMRRDGDLPYDWITDSTRMMRKPDTYTGLGAFIKNHQKAYRRDLWTESDYYVEVWCEKEALAGVLWDVTDEYDVPLMISRGFASESFLYSAAQSFAVNASRGKVPVVLFFGDYDPSGRGISETIERRLREMCPEMSSSWDDDEFMFRRVAVTGPQIDELGLPTRPTKQNTHKQKWGQEDDRSVELDAIPPNDLRAMVRRAVEAFVEQDQLEFLKKVEQEERMQLAAFAKQLKS